MRYIHKTLAAGLLSSAIIGTALGAGNNVDFSSVYVRPKPGNNADEIMTKDIKECSTEASASGTISKQTILFKYRNCLSNKNYKLLN
jgi:hypothetical protein